MNTDILSKTTSLASAAALLGLACFSPTGTTLAAFEPLPPNTPQSPATTLNAGTAGASGTVIQLLDSTFNVAPDIQGTLRSLVVDTGSGYDFYYQVINTGTDIGFGTEIFRIKTIGGFDTSAISVTYLTSLSGLNVGAFGPLNVGTKSIFSADSDQASAGSVGFNFSPSQFLFDPDNIIGGETSRFAVVRTTGTTFVTANADVSGGGTARVAALVAVPEPMSAALILIGIAILLRPRSRRWVV